MIAFEEALEIVLGSAGELEPESVHLADALNRILGEDVRSDVDSPPFSRSAMDGYACRRGELDAALRVVEEIRAGCPPTKPLGRGECSKIMTGAMIPDGADCVIILEETERVNEEHVRFVGSRPANNIRVRGEDARAGDVVLEKGTRLAAQHLAVLASVGGIEPRVLRRPRVGVIATGDELVEPDVIPAISQIRNSNSCQLRAQIVQTGAVPNYYGIVQDTEESIGRAMQTAMGENDVVLLTGGVSVGDFDLVPDVMRKLDVEILFSSIAMKPGKPISFGVTHGAACFGLSGNPVSSFIQFELLVKPFLRALMGHVCRVGAFLLPLGCSISRKKVDRLLWLPIRVSEEGEVKICEYHGSAHVNALCGADGLAAIPVGTRSLDQGARVNVRLF